MLSHILLSRVFSIWSSFILYLFLNVLVFTVDNYIMIMTLVFLEMLQKPSLKYRDIFVNVFLAVFYPRTISFVLPKEITLKRKLYFII